MKFCGKCGAKLEDSAKFCPKCGEMSEDLSQLAPEPVPVKKKSKKLPILAAIALVLVVVVVVTLLLPKKETVYLRTSQRTVFSTGTQEFKWDYDEEGRILRYANTRTYPDMPYNDRFFEYTYTYDNKGRLQGTTIEQYDELIEYRYQYSGDRLSACFSDEVQMDFTVDADGNVTGRIIDGDWSGYDYIECTYHDNGRLQTYNFGIAGTHDYTYSYDDEGHLRSAEGSAYGIPMMAYEYDEYGNPVYMESYSYSSYNGEVETTLVMELHVSYTYKKGEITEITLRDLTGTAHCEVLTAGRTKTYKFNGSSEDYGNYEVVCEHDAHGNLLEQVTYDDGEMVSKVTHTYEAFELPADYVPFTTYDPKYLIN